MFDSTEAYISVTFQYLICFILFDVNLLVAARNFASANFRNSDFLFVLLKCVRYFLEISLKISFGSETFRIPL